MTFRKYGIIFAALGITTTGVLWYDRGLGVQGEDLLECVAAVTERPLAYHQGTNDYAFVSNAVTAAVLWSPLYDTVLCGARAAVTNARTDLIYWITGGQPADGDELDLKTTTIAPFVSLDSRIKTSSVQFYDGASLTNFPITEWLWPYSTTNAITAYTTGAAPWASGNFWTGAGLGTNVYRYACERAQPTTATTNYTYELTARSVTATYTNAYQVGDVYSFAGNVTIGAQTAKQYTCAGRAYSLWYINEISAWRSGPNALTYWSGAAITWPAINQLSFSAQTLDFTQRMTVITNWPFTLNKSVAVTNLNQARTVLTNLCRTVKLGGTLATFAYAGTQDTISGYYNSSVSNVEAFATYTLPNTHDNVQATAAGFIANVQAVAEYETNTVMTAGLAELPLEITPSMAYSYLISRSYLNPPLGEQNIAMDWATTRPGYVGCVISNYPSNYAFRSNYVARYQVFLLVDEYEPDSTTVKRLTRWRLACDVTDPTNTPSFDFAAKSENFTGYYSLATNDFELLCSDHHTVPSGPTYAFTDTKAQDVKTVVTAYAVVVDWKFKHLGAVPFVPDNNVPEWTQ